MIRNVGILYLLAVCVSSICYAADLDLIGGHKKHDAALECLMNGKCFADFTPWRSRRSASAYPQLHASVDDADRIKDEVAKRMEEYLYLFFKTSANQLKPTSSTTTTLFPQGIDYPTYAALENQAAKQQQQQQQQQLPSPLALKLYAKKSGAGTVGGSMNGRQQQIRFHQCYFNPISCFRK